MTAEEGRTVRMRRCASNQEADTTRRVEVFGVRNASVFLKRSYVDDEKQQVWDKSR